MSQRTFPGRTSGQRVAVGSHKSLLLWMEPVYTGNTHTPTSFFRCWEIIKQCKSFFQSLSLNPKSFKNVYSCLGKRSKLICFTFSCMIPSCPCEYCLLACTATVIKRHPHECHLPEVATQVAPPFCHC